MILFAFFLKYSCEKPEIPGLCNLSINQVKVGLSAPSSGLDRKYGLVQQ